MDNLLLKLAEKGVPFLRIGRLSQVEQRLHAWTPGGSHYPDTSVSGLLATALAARVVSSPSACPVICGRGSRHSRLSRVANLLSPAPSNP